MLKRSMAPGERFGYRNGRGEVVAWVTVLSVKSNGEVVLAIESDKPLEPKPNESRTCRPLANIAS